MSTLEGLLDLFYKCSLSSKYIVKQLQNTVIG